MLGRIGRMTVGLLSVGLLSETPVEATWRIDIEGGAFVPGSSVTIGNGGEGDQTEVSTDFNVGGSVAVGGGYSLNDYVELGGQFQSSISGIDIGIASDTFNVSSLTFGPRLYALPSTYRVRPWVVGQIGWYRAHGEVGAFGAGINQTDNGFGANVGGGMDVAVSQHVSLGVDARYHHPVDVFDGLQFVTTMFNVGLHFGAADGR
jgi:hypothetical protein